MNHAIKQKNWALMVSPWIMGILAALELVLGFVLLSFPFLLGASAVWVVGVVLMAFGVLHLVQIFTQRSNRMWNFLAFVLYGLVGLFMVLFTGASLQVWTMLIGVAFLVAGVLRIGVAFSLRGTPGTAWRFFSGIVSFVLGAMVVWQWPQSSLWLIGTIIAVEMIFSGWTLLFMALGPRPAREQEKI